ncbi:MAG: AraC family transcriptional regulator [Bacteroidota bacterium]
MKVRLHASDLKDSETIEITYPPHFHDSEQTVTECVHRPNAWLGEGQYREIFFRGIHIGYGDLSLKENTVIDFESDFESVEMHFAISGQAQATDLLTQKQYRFASNEHNILYAAGIKGQSNWASGTNMQVFEINVLPELFTKYLPDHRIFNAFRAALTRKETSTLLRHNRPITTQMRLIIHEILHCNRTGLLKKMLIEARVIELLLLQLEQIMASSDTQSQPSPYHLRKIDIDRMYTAREIIEANLSNPYSLGALAKQVGTNEFTLKKSFKALFGTTVFGYLHERKMVQAHEMLLEEKDKTITEVSEQCGYQHASHFTAAFKRRFGVLPSQLKHRFS